ncbi:MAG: amidohydrolase family protein [Acidimicrobiales bacterium]
MNAGVLITGAEVEGRTVDVAIADGRISAVGRDLKVRSSQHHDAAGGALLPGLHDHHVHLLATAAAMASVDLAAVGPGDLDGLATALRRAATGRAAGTWLRVVGYHESIAGEVTRDLLDRFVPGHPLRMQHQTGAMWMLNSRAIAELGPAIDETRDGIERDGTGRPTGRLFRLDSWLRGHLPQSAPDLTGLDHALARLGITGVSDMTPYEDVADVGALGFATATGDMRARVVVSGGPGLSATRFPEPLVTGPMKIIVDDHAPPDLDVVANWISVAHHHGRAVAIHAVTRAAAAFALAAWRHGGSRRGDRLEHGAVIPPEIARQLAHREICVVTQPALIRDRGQSYLDDVDPDGQPHLWPCASLLTTGVEMGAGSDSPYGPLDAWAAIETASSRRTATGRSLGAAEAVTARRALGLYLGDPTAPGGPERTVSVGAPADLCLLDRPLADALRGPVRNHVVQTWVRGVAGVTAGRDKLN